MSISVSWKMLLEAGNCPLWLKYMSAVGENRSWGILDPGEQASVYKL